VQSVIAARSVAPVVSAPPAPVLVPRWTDPLTQGGEVTIHGVSKSFGTLKVLDDVTLAVPPGSVTVILGQSAASLRWRSGPRLPAP